MILNENRKEFTMWQNLLLLLGLAALAYQDFKSRTVNLYLILTAGAAGCFLQAVFGQYTFCEVFTGMGIGAAVCLVSFLVKGSIGMGDGCVLILSGVYLGFEHNLELFLTAMYLSGMAALILLVMKKRGRKYRMPFVPFVLAAYVLNLL